MKPPVLLFSCQKNKQEVYIESPVLLLSCQKNKQEVSIESPVLLCSCQKNTADEIFCPAVLLSKNKQEVYIESPVVLSENSVVFIKFVHFRDPAFHLFAK